MQRRQLMVWGTLGVGLGYEVVRGWVIRLALTGGETSRGEATIQYLDGGIPLTRSFEAEWLGVELGLGVQRIFKEFENAQSELIESNTIIQNNLEAEEQSLVELRKTLAADEFRKLAVEFDERANAIRKERAALENTLFELRDENINKLLQLSVPFLQEIMLSYKASVIIDRRNIVLSNPMVDITEKAIELINDKLGDGTKNAD